MADSDPTIEDLQKQMDELNAYLEEIMTTTREVLILAKACEHMAQKLAEKFNEPLADWWWL
tara:strand:+ start:10764 stop:10946 length:183 start_codon:yes stop_codon:yes gene_type:complete